MTNPCWSLATNFENHKIISALHPTPLPRPPLFHESYLVVTPNFKSRMRPLRSYELFINPSPNTRTWIKLVCSRSDEAYRPMCSDLQLKSHCIRSLLTLMAMYTLVTKIPLIWGCRHFRPLLCYHHKSF